MVWLVSYCSILFSFQRKFIRESTNVPANNFYSGFRKWLDENYSIIDQSTWDQIREEDKEIDYETVGNGMQDLCPTEVENTIEVDNEEQSFIENASQINE